MPNPLHVCYCTFFANSIKSRVTNKNVGESFVSLVRFKLFTIKSFINLIHINSVNLIIL